MMSNGSKSLRSCSIIVIINSYLARVHCHVCDGDSLGGFALTPLTHDELHGRIIFDRAERTQMY